MRAGFLHATPSCRLLVYAAKDPPDLEPSVLAHERSAIAVIKNQGGVIYGAQFFPLPDEPGNQDQTASRQ